MKILEQSSAKRSWAEFAYRASERLKMNLGTHVFTGRENGRLGRFHELSGILLKIRYSFSA